MTVSKIAHVYNYMHPHYGGPPNVIVHLIREQLKRGLTVFLMASDLCDPEVQATLPLHPRLILIEIKPRWIRSLFSKKRIHNNCNATKLITPIKSLSNQFVSIGIKPFFLILALDCSKC